MEHLVTIAFDFDDATVTNKIHATVEKTVIDKITAEVEGKIFEKNWGAKKVDPERDSLSWWTERIVKNLFLEHKDEIIGSMVFSGREVPKEAAIVQKVLDIVGDANAIIPTEEGE